MEEEINLNLKTFDEYVTDLVKNGYYYHLKFIGYGSGGKFIFINNENTYFHFKEVMLKPHINLEPYHCYILKTLGDIVETVLIDTTAHKILDNRIIEQYFSYKKDNEYTFQIMKTRNNDINTFKIAIDKFRSGKWNVVFSDYADLYRK